MCRHAQGTGEEKRPMSVHLSDHMHVHSLIFTRLLPENTLIDLLEALHVNVPCHGGKLELFIETTEDTFRIKILFRYKRVIYNQLLLYIYILLSFHLLLWNLYQCQWYESITVVADWYIMNLTLSWRTLPGYWILHVITGCIIIWNGIVIKWDPIS